MGRFLLSKEKTPIKYHVLILPCIIIPTIFLLSGILISTDNVHLLNHYSVPGSPMTSTPCDLLPWPFLDGYLTMVTPISKVLLFVPSIGGTSAWQPTPVFLSGESHGQRSLVGYSPQGRKESDMTEWQRTVGLPKSFCCDHSAPGIYQCCLILSTIWCWEHVRQSLSRMRLCNPMDCNPTGFSVHGILQARVLEWVAMPFSRESSWTRCWTWVSRIEVRFFTIWATSVQFSHSVMLKHQSFQWMFETACL